MSDIYSPLSLSYRPWPRRDSSPPASADMERRTHKPTATSGSFYSGSAPVQFSESGIQSLELALETICRSSAGLSAHWLERHGSLKHSDLMLLFVEISRDKVASKVLSRLRGEQGQAVLNTLQMVLDHESASSPPSGVPRNFKRVLHLLLQLAKHSRRYPASLILSGVQREEGDALTGGHYAEIWRGRFCGKPVCVKVLREYIRSDIDRLLRTFCREAILWSHLVHENVLPFYGIYRTEGGAGRMCLISPWMENGNLKEYLECSPNSDRISLARDVSRGMLYLHEQGIVHGDLKGVNILISNSGRPLVADFGLSSIAEDSYIQASSTAVPSGTVRWQAPELFDPNAEDTRPTQLSDIYSLGCVFYEIFTGKMPFYEVPQHSVIACILAGKQPLKPARDSRAFQKWGLSKRIWKLCIQQSWARTPEERPKISQFLAPDMLGDTPPRFTPATAAVVRVRKEQSGGHEEELRFEDNQRQDGKERENREREREREKKRTRELEKERARELEGERMRDLKERERELEKRKGWGREQEEERGREKQHERAVRGFERDSERNADERTSESDSERGSVWDRIIELEENGQEGPRLISYTKKHWVFAPREVDWQDAPPRLPEQATAYTPPPPGSPVRPPSNVAVSSFPQGGFEFFGPGVVPSWTPMVPHPGHPPPFLMIPPPPWDPSTYPESGRFPK